jgi:hypothetical protein
MRTLPGIHDRRLILPPVRVMRQRRAAFAESKLRADREFAIGQTGVSPSSTPPRLKEVGKAFAASGSIFVCPRFRAGVYGLNASAMPGLGRPFADPALWIARIPTAMRMPVALRRRRRIGDFSSNGDDAGHE